MTQYLNIDSGFIEDPQAFRTEYQRTRLLPTPGTDVIRDESRQRRVFNDIQLLRKNKVPMDIDYFRAPFSNRHLSPLGCGSLKVEKTRAGF